MSERSSLGQLIDSAEEAIQIVLTTEGYDIEMLKEAQSQWERSKDCSLRIEFQEHAARRAYRLAFSSAPKRRVETVVGSEIYVRNYGLNKPYGSEERYRIHSDGSVSRVHPSRSGEFLSGPVSQKELALIANWPK